MILIADSGGTKVEWCLIGEEGEVKRFNTLGMNAMMLTTHELATRVHDEVATPLGEYRLQVREIDFYGAGCVSDEVCAHVRNAIAESFPNADIRVYTDLLGTARALCGRSPGIACILGTGSNSCLYDGDIIVKNVSALGYILGDEGSGAYLGKVLIADVLKRQLPDEVIEKFQEKHHLDAVTVINRVYREPYAQRFLASLTPFLKENIEHPAVHKLVYDAFCAFFRRNLCLYPKEYPVNFSGSIAYYYRDVLDEAAKSEGFTLGKVIKAPMDDLINYHLAR